MAMGKRKTCRQQPLFVAATDLPRTPAHPFYERLNQMGAISPHRVFSGKWKAQQGNLVD